MLRDYGHLCISVLTVPIQNINTVKKQNVQAIGSYIAEYECNPFTLENTKIRSRQFGVLTSSALVDGFEYVHMSV